MKPQIFTGRGWINVPEAKLGPGNEVLGWVVKRDLWLFALHAGVAIKVENHLSSIYLTRFVVTGTPANVKAFQKILARAVDLHNQPRFPNMRIPVVTWEMTIGPCQKQVRRK